MCERTDHDQRYHQTRAGRDAQDKRACDRVGKKGLQQEAGNRQRAAQQNHSEDARQTDIQDDCGIFTGAVQQSSQYLSDGHLQAAGMDVPDQQHQQQYNQYDEG